MPTYLYRCATCNLTFDKLRPSGPESATAPCLKCKAPAPKKVSASNFAFAHEPISATIPPNTGVERIDHSFDLAVGRESARNWKKYEQVSLDKRNLLAQHPGSRPEDIVAIRNERGEREGYALNKPTR